MTKKRRGTSRAARRRQKRAKARENTPQVSGEKFDCPRPFAIQLVSGAFAALQCWSDQHAIERAEEFSDERGSGVHGVCRIENGEPTILVAGKRWEEPYVPA